MSKSKLISFFLIALYCLLLTGCSSNTNNNTNNSSVSYNISSERTSTDTNIFSNISINTITSNENGTNVKEKELATFSTNLSGKDSPRSRNIKLTTSKLNGTTVNNNEIFSFCDTIGNPTAEDGYEKADSFDANGNKVQTYGGGNCQVSSTLYNAVLAISNLEVKERHAHSKEVHYVAKDKDAAVSYGSVDFKFKNNTGNAIKIYADSDLSSVNIRIVEILD